MLDPAQALALAQTLIDRSLAAGATGADAFYSGGRSDSVSVRLGALEQVNKSESESVSLRLFDGARSASVSSSDFSDEALDQLVERCRAMAREAPEDPFAGLAPPGLLEHDPPSLDLGDFRERGPEDLRGEALEAERAAMAVRGVSNSGGCSASASVSVVAMATSGGFAGAFRSGGHGRSASVIAGEGAGMQRDYASHTARHLDELEAPEEIGRLAGERAAARLRPIKVEAGTYPVIFDPRVSSTLLGHFSAAISGGAVARGTSFLKDRLGAQIFTPGVSIIDDPLRERGLRSRPFDGEGVRVGRRDIVADGRLTQWMAATAAARQLGIQPTGHAAHSAGSPGIAPSNFYLGAGRRSRGELLAAHPSAILVVELIGMGVNGVTGDYSRGAAGFMVRGGEIAEPIVEFTIASNLIEMFATLEPASDLDFRKGIDAPTVLVPAMTVA